MATWDALGTLRCIDMKSDAIWQTASSYATRNDETKKKKRDRGGRQEDITNNTENDRVKHVNRARRLHYYYDYFYCYDYYYYYYYK